MAVVRVVTGLGYLAESLRFFDETSANNKYITDRSGVTVLFEQIDSKLKWLPAGPADVFDGGSASSSGSGDELDGGASS